VTVTVTRGDELARSRGGVADVLGAEAVEVVARTDHLRVAIGGGELLALLADAGERAAIRLLVGDGRSVEVRLCTRRRAEGIPGECRVLRRDAGVEHADDDALTGCFGSADGGPDTVVTRESEELGRRGGGDVQDLVGGHREHVLVRSELRGLLASELGRERVEGHGVGVVDVRANRRGDLLLGLGELLGVGVG
jgi:hypothetical protein